ncbi:hypothetical protein BCA37_24265 [Mycobacterium sp. djl-10]|nr:hypothetical protein BCA37_24265 [Mycobacterium sp. djl-10]
MSRFRKLFTGAALAAGTSAAALLTAGAASAEPAPVPPAPAMPGMDMIQQFVANPAGALQAASSLLTNFSGAQAAPAAPAPLATASLAVPNPTTGALPVANAAAPALSVPSIPGVPLPAGVSLPPNLTSLIPMPEANGIPTLGNSTTVPGAVQPPTPAAPGLGPLFPVSALP